MHGLRPALTARVWHIEVLTALSVMPVHKPLSLEPVVALAKSPVEEQRHV